MQHLLLKTVTIFPQSLRSSLQNAFPLLFTKISPVWVSHSLRLLTSHFPSIIKHGLVNLSFCLVSYYPKKHKHIVVLKFCGKEDYRSIDFKFITKKYHLWYSIIDRYGHKCVMVLRYTLLIQHKNTPLFFLDKHWQLCKGNTKSMLTEMKFNYSTEIKKEKPVSV